MLALGVWAATTRTGGNAGYRPSNSSVEDTRRVRVSWVSRVELVGDAQLLAPKRRAVPRLARQRGYLP
jgi:hypothetical protein